MSEDVKQLTECLACGGDDLKLILDLNEQPMANEFVSDITAPEKTFPLRLNVCVDCTHLQLSHAVNPDLLFKNYLYVSGTTKTLRDYFDWFAEFALSFWSKDAKSVLDIACNDGTQLNSFKKLGLKTYGIDPAENLYELSSKDHTVICDYLKREHVEKLKDTKIDIINAQNVFAHNSYPLEFLEICKDIMHDDSYLFIQTSQADMIVNNEFDTLYHEHLSFFNANSMQALANRAGLKIVDIIKTPIHGNSYVFVFSKQAQPKMSVDLILTYERQIGLQNLETYAIYAEKAKHIVSKLNAELLKRKNNGYKLVGYGAAAKGNTLLNFGKIQLDFIIDDNPLKQGLYTPGTHIPVVSIDSLIEFKNEKIAFVPLAWNFFAEIKSNIQKVRGNPNDIFIRYFPKIDIS
jgi:2-polyprenyl-3-methyl-5-hydroxy-6-metoxy-1,4-benzoquinol methylase